MGNPVGTFFTLIRKNIILIIIGVIIGNTLHWYSKKNETAHFEYKVEAKANADLYDPIRRVFDRVSLAKTGKDPIVNFTDEEKKRMNSIDVNSYRNESQYVLELAVKFNDTTAAEQIIDKVANAINTDTTLKTLYFKRLENLKKLMNEYSAFITSASHADSLNFENRSRLLTMRYQRQNLQNELNQFKATYSIIIHPKTDIVYIPKNNSLKGYLLATIMFFVISLVLAIILEQFKKVKAA